MEGDYDQSQEIKQGASDSPSETEMEMSTTELEKAISSASERSHGYGDLVKKFATRSQKNSQPV